KKFDKMLFSSHTTCNLVQKQLRVNETNIKRLHMHRWYIIEPKRYVYLADANHCPGAVCFVFKIDKKFLFHCGDFRACDEFYNQFDRVDDVFVYNLSDEIVEEHRVVNFFNLEVKITAKLIQYKGQNEKNYVFNYKNFFCEDKNIRKNVIDVDKNVNDMQNIFNINNANEVSIENAFENIYKTNNINAIEKEKIIDKNLKEKTNEVTCFPTIKRNSIYENKKIHTNNNTKLIKFENKI
ncbi:DNA cross-link repair 1A protein, partial [Conglomerata obtusa]